MPPRATSAIWPRDPGVQGPYPAMYYPHNIHFEMTAALMAGQGEPALRSADSRASSRMRRRSRSPPRNPSSRRLTSSTPVQRSPNDPGASLPKRETAIRGCLLAICPGIAFL